MAPDAPLTPITELPDTVLHYLLQSRYCPSDKMQDKALAVVGNALCRSLQIPARYLHRLHAWFEAFVGGRWYTFDATQDAPRAGLKRCSLLMAVFAVECSAAYRYVTGTACSFAPDPVPQRKCN